MEINQVNCKNCGAPLHYDLTSKMAKCEYCDSEYYLDKIDKVSKELNDITNDIVELEIYGKKMNFYVSQIEVEPIYTSYRTFNDRIERCVPIKKEYIITLVSC